MLDRLSALARTRDGPFERRAAANCLEFRDDGEGTRSPDALVGGGT
jgi:hypothetical protein